MCFGVFVFSGKVHGSLARAGKVRGQTPKVAKQDKKKKPRGRAHKRMQYNRRFVTAGIYIYIYIYISLSISLFCVFCLLLASGFCDNMVLVQGFEMGFDEFVILIGAIVFCLFVCSGRIWQEEGTQLVREVKRLSVLG